MVELAALVAERKDGVVVAKKASSRPALPNFASVRLPHLPPPFCPLSRVSAEP